MPAPVRWRTREAGADLSLKEQQPYSFNECGYYAICADTADQIEVPTRIHHHDSVYTNRQTDRPRRGRSHRGIAELQLVSEYCARSALYDDHRVLPAEYREFVMSPIRWSIIYIYIYPGQSSDSYVLSTRHSFTCSMKFLYTPVCYFI